MCRCMDWMEALILTSRWCCKTVARTGCDGQWPGGSRALRYGYFSITSMHRAMLAPISWSKLPKGSRIPRSKQLFSGLGEVVR